MSIDTRAGLGVEIEKVSDFQVGYITPSCGASGAGGDHARAPLPVLILLNRAAHLARQLARQSF